MATRAHPTTYYPPHMLVKSWTSLPPRTFFEPYETSTLTTTARGCTETMCHLHQLPPHSARQMDGWRSGVLCYFSLRLLKLRKNRVGRKLDVQAASMRKLCNNLSVPSRGFPSATATLEPGGVPIRPPNQSTAHVYMPLRSVKNRVIFTFKVANPCSF